MIEAHDLTRKFGDFTAVAGVSFSLQEGEIVGILGPNGAGKTTTIRMLTGFLPPSSGRVTLGGTLSLFAGNQITFNLTDTGLNAGQTYELLNFVDGGFTSGVLANTDYILGATPGGFSSIILTANNNRISPGRCGLLMPRRCPASLPRMCPMPRRMNWWCSNRSPKSCPACCFSSALRFAPTSSACIPHSIGRTQSPVLSLVIPRR